MPTDNPTEPSDFSQADSTLCPALAAVKLYLDEQFRMRQIETATSLLCRMPSRRRIQPPNLADMGSGQSIPFCPEFSYKNGMHVSESTKKGLTLLASFAIAMALLEAAVVVYMRRLYYPENPLELFPLAFLNSYDPILELSREVATIVMIVTVALLAERKNWTRGFAAFVFVFGVWDLFYYVWLKVLMDWPRTWLEWDVLFLIPMIWLGPWICPALIAALFMVWGGWILLSREQVILTPRGFTIFVTGAVLGLIAFMQPAATIMINEGSNSLAVLCEYVPGKFWWWLFVPSFLLMAWGLSMTNRVVGESRVDGPQVTKGT